MPLAQAVEYRSGDKYSYFVIEFDLMAFLVALSFDVWWSEGKRD